MLQRGDDLEIIEKAVEYSNSIVWGPVMLAAFLSVGIYYSVKIRFFQIKGFGYWWKKTIGSLFNKDLHRKDGIITPFRAMTTALAGAIGTGNIVGVASALSLGGAGALFWMWIAAFLGMATVFAENVIGVKFRVKLGKEYVGGPMYYIEKGLRNRPLAVIFALLCTFASLGMGNMTQSNSASGAIKYAFGIDPYITGIILCIITGLAVFGGIGRISYITEKLLPVMSVLYILFSIVILLINRDRIIPVLFCIIKDAFGTEKMIGGFMGYGISRALRFGISRGVFSNEAGLGSSPIVHAAAQTNDPYTQGMWGIFQVFTDTIVMCTLMALCILTTSCIEPGRDGISICVQAFKTALGKPGEYFICLSIFVFAFATLISWCYYGEKGLEYLTGQKYIKIYRIVYTLAAFLGCILSIELVWDISDLINGLMAIPNLIALFMLGKHIKYEEILLKK